jgi:cobalt-zinc-cadmium efflux system outer membrane protein
MGVGMTIALPVFNRNQGGIQRANLDVSQTQLDLEDLRRQVLVDVEKSLEEYEVTRREVAELRDDVVPVARKVRDDARKLYLPGRPALSPISMPSSTSTRSPSDNTSARPCATG